MDGWMDSVGVCTPAGDTQPGQRQLLALAIRSTRLDVLVDEQAAHLFQQHTVGQVLPTALRELVGAAQEAPHRVQDAAHAPEAQQPSFGRNGGVVHKRRGRQQRR